MPPKMVRCVEGDLPREKIGLCDAHNHLWIEPPPGLPDNLPVLNCYPEILQELKDYRRSGGNSIVDCQPGGCGRNGNVLKRLSRESAVHVVACTGFHLARYYPQDHWLFLADADRARDTFISEITTGLEENRADPKPVRAGFIKVACHDQLAESPLDLLEAAAQAAIQTGVAVEVHTEKGCDAEQILAFFKAHGLDPKRLVLCHMDKRPDLGLHQELASEGSTLEYDTFYRPQYQPEKHLWRLIDRMVEAGFESHIAMATDMASATMWRHLGQGPGLTGFVDAILKTLQEMGFASAVVAGLMGGNIASCLALQSMPG
jgi:predicted metal-dependent phosphotriesterase family hydrolase